MLLLSLSSPSSWLFQFCQRPGFWFRTGSRGDENVGGAQILLSWKIVWNVLCSAFFGNTASPHGCLSHFVHIYTAYRPKTPRSFWESFLVETRNQTWKISLAIMYCTMSFSQILFFLLWGWWCPHFPTPRCQTIEVTLPNKNTIVY